MARVRVHDFTISLDGYGAGPNQSTADPLGAGGESLHDWVIDTRTFKQTHGGEGGSTDVDDDVAARAAVACASHRTKPALRGRAGRSGPHRGRRIVCLGRAGRDRELRCRLAPARRAGPPGRLVAGTGMNAAPHTQAAPVAFPRGPLLAVGALLLCVLLVQ